MTGYFLNNKLNLVEVHENAQSVTFVDEEADEKENKPKERLGINISNCGIIEAEIDGNNVEVLACRIQAASKLYPESKLPPEMKYLKDFKWRGDEKMLKWQDIFGDDPDYIEIKIKEVPESQVETPSETEKINLDELLNSEEEENEKQN